MKKWIASAIVRLRFVILVLLLGAAGISVPMIQKSNINYDLNEYLSEETMTKRALSVMRSEFGSNEQLRVMFENITEQEARRCLGQLKALPQVKLVTYDEEDVRTVGDVTYRLMTLNLDEGDDTALVRELRSMFPGYRYQVGGASALRLDLQTDVAKEIPVVMAISLAIVIFVLLLTSHAYLEPLAILFVLAICILINLGTNFLFPSISFITFAVSPILQLALSIDYAIMLLHSYDALLEEGYAPREAMKEALENCFMPIASSAFTTVAGLLSLTFMSFKIGFDIGVVLSKGILISMAGVFLLMPSVCLLLTKPLMATRHKPLPFTGKTLQRVLYRGRHLLLPCLLLLVAAGAYYQSQGTYLFSDAGMTKKGESYCIEEVYGASNPLVFLVPGGDKEEEYDRQRKLIARLQDLELPDQSPAIRNISGMVTMAEDALKYVTPREVSESTGIGLSTVNLYFSSHGYPEKARVLDLLSGPGLKLLASLSSYAFRKTTLTELQDELDLAKVVFLGKHYDRILLDLHVMIGDKDFQDTMDKILEAADDIYGEEYYVTGMPVSNTDISRAFQGDLRKVNLLTFLSILLIVTLSFRSLRLALLLVFVIEGAIWITMGISALQGEAIFFMSYLICLSIQMGATIDYGILLVNQYRGERRGQADIQSQMESQGEIEKNQRRKIEQKNKQEALKATLGRSLPTILTSGAILTTAGYIIGKKCTVYYISSIGSLLSRGAAISVLLVLILLPVLLLMLDKAVGMKKRKREKQTYEKPAALEIEDTDSNES